MIGPQFQPKLRPDRIGFAWHKPNYHYLSPSMSRPGVIERPEVDDGSTTHTDSWIVTVFNNDYNTWEEVMEVLMRATGCNSEEAYIETWEVDNLGRSVVHCASERECQGVANVISTIGIRVEVSQG